MSLYAAPNQRLLGEIHEIMGGAERSAPLSNLIEPTQLAGRIKVRK